MQPAFLYGWEWHTCIAWEGLDPIRSPDGRHSRRSWADSA
jgi:hypothetical protein